MRVHSSSPRVFTLLPHSSLPTLFKLDVSGVGDVVNIDKVDVGVPFNLNCRESQKLNVRRSRFEAWHFPGKKFKRIIF